MGNLQISTLKNILLNLFTIRYHAVLGTFVCFIPQEKSAHSLSSTFWFWIKELNNLGIEGTIHIKILTLAWNSHSRLSTRVGILACLRILDPFFFLWAHKFQVKLTFMPPTGCTSIYLLSEIFNAKLLMIHHGVATKHHNIPVKHCNILTCMCWSILKKASCLYIKHVAF